MPLLFLAALASYPPATPAEVGPSPVGVPTIEVVNDKSLVSKHHWLGVLASCTGPLGSACEGVVQLARDRVRF